MSKSFDFKQIKVPFKYKDFGKYFSAALIFRIGVFITYTAFIIEATKLKGNSPLYLGLIGFAYNIPIFILNPFTGVLADRINRVKIIRITQLLYMIPAIIPAIMILTGHVNYWIIFTSAFIYGSIFSIENPSTNALVKDIVYNPKDVSSAMGLIGTSIRATQFIGSGVAGLIITVTSVIACFFSDFFLHIAAFLIFVFIKKTKQKKETSEHPMNDLKEGFKYTYKSYPLAITIIFISLNGFFAWPYLFQLPIVNTYTLSGSSLTLGIMLALGGLGGALGGLYMSMRKHFLGLTKIIYFSLILIGLSFLLFSFSRKIWLSTIFIFMLDFGITLFMVAATAFVQVIAEDRKRGRVMSFFIMANIGLVPFGSILFYGLIGELIGDIYVFSIAGAVFLIAAIIYIKLLPKIRHESFKILSSRNVLTQKDINKI